MTDLFKIIIAALLCLTGLPPLGAWPLVWLGIVLFCFILLNCRKNPITVAGFALLFYFMQHLTASYWIEGMLRHYLRIPLSHSVLLAGLAFFLMSLPAFFLALIWSKSRCKLNNRFELIISLTIFLSLADVLTLLLVPWSTIFSIHRSELLTASFYYLGRSGWRLLFFASAAAVAVNWNHWPTSFWQKAVRTAGVCALIFGYVGAIGLLAMDKLQALHPDRQPVAIVQNFYCRVDRSPACQGENSSDTPKALNGRMVKQVIDHPVSTRWRTDSREVWLAWGEKSLAYKTLSSADRAKPFSDWAAALNGLVFATASVIADGSRHQNSVALVDQYGYHSFYAKRLRFPIAETPGVKELAYSYVKYLVSITGRQTIEAAFISHPRDNSTIFVPLICLEGFSGWFVSSAVKAARSGAQNQQIVVINPSFDYWFNSALQSEQHFITTRINAATEGVPWIRAAEGGISAIISPWGKVIARSSHHQRVVVSGELPVQREIINAPAKQRYQLARQSI